MTSVPTDVTSSTQREIWATSQLGEEASRAFHAALVYELSSPPDQEALRAAVEEVLGRRPELKCAFTREGSRLRTAVDTPTLETAAGEVSWRDLAQQAVDRPFDLAEGPLVRFAVVTGSDGQALVLVSHQALLEADVLADVAEELAAIVRGDAPASVRSTSAPAVASEVEAEAHWRDELGGFTHPLDLPVPKTRPAIKTYHGASLEIELPGWEERSASADRALLATAVCSLMHRFTGSTDVVIGCNLAARHPSQSEIVIPLRVEVGPESRFRELLEVVESKLVAAEEYRNVSFANVLPHLEIERDPSRLPIFPITVAVNGAGRTLQLGGVKGTERRFVASAAVFELEVVLERSDGSATLRIVYNPDLFDRPTAEHHLDALAAHLLAAADDRGQANVAELPVLSPAQQTMVLRDWNDTETAYPRDAPIHAPISRVAEDSPRRVAVEAGGICLTYQELEERSNRLARLLAQRGVRPGGLVGLCLDRGIDLVPSLLGILKAGAGYVPLDPAFPRDRLAYMCEDSGLEVLVTSRSLESIFGGVATERGVKILKLDELEEELAAQSCAAPEVEYDPEALAYVIYTSGSTGLPKGVQVPSACVVNFLASSRSIVGIHEDDRLLALTTLSFDIAVLEIYLPLWVGATVVVASSEQQTDGRMLADLIESAEVTILQATPTTYRMMIEGGWNGSPGVVGISAGEALPQELTGPLLERVDRLWDLYGPTETTVFSTAFEVTDPDAPVLIGKPYANTQVYILDARLEPVAIGVTGDLYIGGDGVTLGYRNREELTAEKFIEHPYEPTPTCVSPAIYATGDKARWRASGDVEYLGREDRQVKIRGFRIELGEIEQVLAQHEAVRECVVDAQEVGPGDHRLVAFVIAEEDEWITSSEVRSFLRDSLPRYMIPQHVVELDEFPLTNNKKVDRKSLPRVVRPAAAPDQQELRTPAEELVAASWRCVLGDIGVTRSDNFFNLGGHSLLGIRSLIWLEEKTGVRISLRELVLGSLEQVAAVLETSASPQALEGVAVS